MHIRKTIRQIDRAFLGGLLTRCYGALMTFYGLLIAKKTVRYKTDFLNYGFDVQYRKNDHSLLNILSDTYGSDKGEVTPDLNPYAWSSHNYADFYDLIFGLRRNDVISVVECGLGTNNPDLKSSMGINGMPGASLRMWRDYFPNANIIGCDIDSHILFTEERIKTFYCDQTSTESVNTFLKNAKIVENSVDIIIDDGLHEYSAGICFFENMIGSLRNDGLYIIEDVDQTNIIKFKTYFCQKIASFDARFIYLKSPVRRRGDDNNLICITRKQKI